MKTSEARKRYPEFCLKACCSYRVHQGDCTANIFNDGECHFSAEEIEAHERKFAPLRKRSKGKR